MAKIVKSKSERKAKPKLEPETFSLISSEKLLAIYFAMVKCRMFEQRAASLFQSGKLASDLHASSGREATSASLAIDLLPKDTLSLSPGDWLPAFVKGTTPENLFRILAFPSSQLNGKSPSPLSELEQKDIFALDEGHRPEFVCERAIAAQAAKEGAIIAAILPSAEELIQPWHGTMAAAASKRLPIVFVHHVALVHRVAAANQSDKPPANGKAKYPDALVHGVPAIAVDAYDAVAVYRVAYEAIVRARQGRGATLLQCFTDPGAATATRGNVGHLSVEHLPTIDPVSSMENYLLR
ncbi:MAG: thiamine pyrophosphate-dependent enzyme, partial [Terracidiphilus sp.]